jgi:hypothetical protein
LGTPYIKINTAEIETTHQFLVKVLHIEFELGTRNILSDKPTEETRLWYYVKQAGFKIGQLQLLHELHEFTFNGC